MLKSKVLAGLPVMAVLATAVSGVTVAQDAIAKRKEIMKVVGSAVKTSTEMIKGDRPFEAKSAIEAMHRISTTWSEFAKLYPKGTETGGNTTASPKIWENFKDFDEKGLAMANAAAAASIEAGESLDAFKTAFGEVTKTCKGCHQEYRIKR